MYSLVNIRNIFISKTLTNIMSYWKNLQHLKQNEIKRLQNKLLRNFVNTHLHYHPFYKNMFKEKRLRFSDIKTIDDLKKVSFTSKADIVPTAKNPRKFLDFVLQPNKKLVIKHSSFYKKIKIALNKNHMYHEYKPVHMHFTTGRSSNSVPIFYTAHDLEIMEESGRRMFEILNIGGDARVVNAFPYAPHLAFWQTFYAVKANNLLGLQTGGGKVLGTDKIIKSLESMKATCLVGMPGYIYHLLRTAEDQGRNLNNLDSVVLGGERVPEGFLSKLKFILKNLYSENARILSTYAFTEGKCAWVECKSGSGYHLYPDFELIEIVDRNGERVNEGEKGEIVYTSLNWRGSVFLRYKTGDIAKGIYYEKCPYCSRTVPRIDCHIERSSEYKDFKLTKIKGSFVNLNVFFPIMMSHKDILEWQVEIRKKNSDPYEVDELVIYVSVNKKVNFQKLSQELKQNISEETEVTPEIVKLELKEIIKRLGIESELKEKRIVDTRSIR